MGTLFANESHTLGRVLNGLRASSGCWKLKKSFAERGWVDASIGLPSNLVQALSVLAEFGSVKEEKTGDGKNK